MVDGSKKNDSLEDGFFLEDDVFAAEPIGGASEERPSLKQVWQNNPSLKILAIVFFIAVLLIGFLAFGSSEDDIDPKEDVSMVKPGSDVAEAPGTAQVTPAYEEAVRKVNEDRLKQAEVTGGSSLPTPIAKTTERIEAPVQIEETDTLAEWRSATEERRVERKQQEEKIRAEEKEKAEMNPIATAPIQQEDQSMAPQLLDTVSAGVAVAPPPPPPPLPTAPTPEQIQGYMQMIQGQMQTVMETQVPKESTIIKMGIENMGGQQEQPRGEVLRSNVTASQALNLSKAKALRALGPALVETGEIVYAQTLTEANSDIQGPILVEIASGPLAGGRALGTFQKIDKTGTKKLTMTFNKITKDGIEYNANAIAIDPATTLPAIVTDVENHYFSRVVLPAAAKFVEGFTEAATRKDTQVVVTNGTVVTDSNNELDTQEQFLEAANTAGQEISEFVDKEADREVTIKVAMGTRIGLLFTQAVYDPIKVAEYQAELAQVQGQPQDGFQGAAQDLFSATPAGQAISVLNNFSAANWGSQSQQMPQQMMNQAQQYMAGQPNGQPMQGQPQVNLNQIYPGQMLPNQQQQQYQQPLIQNP